MKTRFLVALALFTASGASAQQAPVSAEVEQAYIRRMHSDLRNLLSAQEIHYSEHSTYAGPSADVNQVAALRFLASRGVELRVLQADERGWAGVASSRDVPGLGCAVFVGSATPPATPAGTSLEVPGVVTCDRDPSYATSPSPDDAVGAMRSDLRNLMSAQEVHYSDSMTYASDLRRLQFVASPGITVRVTAASERGNAATATNGAIGCAYFVGNAAPPSTARGVKPTEEGRVVCD
jgi:hypothetical protein